MKKVFSLMKGWVCCAGLVLTVAALLGPPWARAASDNWIKDPVTGCAVWNSQPEGEETISWSGGCHEGKASGRGFLVWFTDGRVTGRFEGRMASGKAWGFGKMDFWLEKGYAHYEGEFKDSEMHGRGTLIFPDKAMVKGDFKHDKLEGYVDYRAADGARYLGEVKNNEPQGEGRQILPSGEEYQGGFRDGNREGQGTLLFPNGDIYTGSFKAGLPEGKGRLQTVEGGIYEGPFHAGLPDGEGVFHTPNGNVARGRTVRGVPDGRIIIKLKDGGTEEQLWKMGKQVKR